MAKPRPESSIDPKWWDFTTLDKKLLATAAKLEAKDMPKLARKGFEINFYDTIEDFYTAEALEYIEAWRQATPSRPAGICGPIGPTGHLPLVARIVNTIRLDLKHAHFWGMDEWVVGNKEVGKSFPLSFAQADWDYCFGRIDPKLRMPMANLHFPAADVKPYVDSWKKARCVIMQGGQGEVTHWAFNDPVRREGEYADQPPTPEEYADLGTRVVDLHPLTVIQNAHSSAGGRIQDVPRKAVTVGPRETWQAECVSIWQPGFKSNQLGLRLTAYMISNKIMDSSVPITLLAKHPNVKFNYYRPGFGTSAGTMSDPFFKQ